jgi:plasmid stabilization system protein ParE
VEESLFEVRWTEPAEEDLDEIIDEIGENSPVTG